MEWLTAIVAGLLAILTPAGLIIDKVAESTIREQVKSVETLAVRVDNVPSYQALSGKVSRLRIASRGLEPLDDFRIDTLDLETDPIDFNLKQLAQSKANFRRALRQPLQGGVHIVLTAADLNRALASDSFKNSLQQRLNRILPEDAPKFILLSAKVNFDQRDRLQAEIELQQGEGEEKETLALTVAAGIEVVGGRSLKLFDPQATLNGRKLSTRILNSITDQINGRLDARSLENKGLWVRVLQWNLGEGKLDSAGFFRITPLLEPSP